jgi:hypothetical protein
MTDFPQVTGYSASFTTRTETRTYPKPPVPNRLVTTPPELYARLEETITKEHHPALRLKMLRKVIDMAYGRGYMDGYRDGHADAEMGHDERVIASAT